MKSGKLLTVTALTTGITLGTFVDSAQARGRGRYSRSSAIPDLSFTLVEQSEEPDNDDFSGEFLGAVDNLFYLNNNDNSINGDIFPVSFFTNPSDNSFDFEFTGNLRSELLGNVVTYTITPDAPFDVSNLDEVDDNNIEELSGIDPYEVYTFDLDFSSTSLTQSVIQDNYVNSLSWLSDESLPSLPSLFDPDTENLTLRDKDGNLYELPVPFPDPTTIEPSCNDNGFCVERKNISVPESSMTISLLAFGLVSLGLIRKHKNNY